MLLLDFPCQSEASTFRRILKRKVLARGPNSFRLSEGKKVLFCFFKVCFLYPFGARFIDPTSFLIVHVVSLVGLSSQISEFLLENAGRKSCLKAPEYYPERPASYILICSMRQ